jgi:acyl-coenzyme A thioesterase PaaI-like protein
MTSTAPLLPAPLGPLKLFVLRQALNLWPCIRGSGGRVTELAPDFTRLVVQLKLSWRTRNVVGTIFGGSMMASTDPMLMLMLQRILGKGYVVWDKRTVTHFKRPARSTLAAEFVLTPEKLAQVRAAVAERGEADFTWTIQYKDAAGLVHAEFDKTLYVATKAFYKAKMAARDAAPRLEAG